MAKGWFCKGVEEGGAVTDGATTCYVGYNSWGIKICQCGKANIWVSDGFKVLDEREN